MNNSFLLIFMVILFIQSISEFLHHALSMFEPFFICFSAIQLFPFIPSSSPKILQIDMKTFLLSSRLARDGMFIKCVTDGNLRSFRFQYPASSVRSCIELEAVDIHHGLR